MRAIFGRAVAPATATFQDLHDAANDAPIILPFDASHVRRQVRFDPFPLLVAQPKEIASHDPDPFKKRIRIVLSARKIKGHLEK